MSSNSVEAWNKFYLFAPRCLRLPKNSKTTDSLASHVKRQLQDDLATSPTSTSTIKQNKKAKKSFNPGLYLARQVSMKIEEGDFRGAIRLAGSDNTLVVFSDETYDALCSKHPPPHPNSQIPPNPTMSTLYAFGVSCADVIQAVRSFSCGLAGGADRLHPQHRKDLLQQVGDEGLDECPLLTVLADFCSLVLRGDVPRAVRPFFFGASLVALRKKTGGVRPIAVGCTLRRLVAKIAGRKVLDEMTNLLAPHQLGYEGTRWCRGCGSCCSSIPPWDGPETGYCEVEFCQCFQFCTERLCPLCCPDIVSDLYLFIHSAYAASSNLVWGDRSITSAEGVQQGDPLGPLIFCLALHQQSLHLRSDFQAMYLDDVTLGGGVVRTSSMIFK